jgi:hypothetical protein
MAVPISNVTRRAVYAPSGAGGVGPYAFTFEILANTDIAVFKDDVLLTLTTHYTVTINANGTGSVTITAAGLALSPTSPTQYAIVGNRTIARATDFTTGGDFFANTINDELDQQTIFAQQNAEGLQRALTAPQTDPTTIDMTLPKAADRANKTLAFDSNGDPTLGISAADVANAVTYATNAANSATAAASSASSASSSASAASASASTASTQASNASTSATNASNSASGASTSATNAAASASTATTQASNASTSATNAASSASAASTSASNAATSETNAAASASTASTQATNASNSATAASGSATSAASSAAAAASALDSFDDRYLGTKTSDPTLDNDGNALVAGALYFSTTQNVMKVYDGASWITATSAGATSLLRFRYVATSGQTTFSGADAAAATLTYTVNNIAVHRNGVTLDTSEYTASNGTSIVLTVAAGTGDIIDIIAFKSFTVADALSAVSGGTVNGAVTITGVTTVQAGTVSAPAITTTGDTNTGIFFPAADTIAFSEGGAEAMRIDSSGNVGIGTSSPTAKAQIGDATVVATNRLVFGKAVAASEGNLPAIGQQSATGAGNDLAIAATSTSGVVRFYTGASTNSGEIGTGSNTERARIDSSGNVGIGVTPSAWSSTKAIEVGSLGTALWSSGAGSTSLSAGAYYNSGWKYANSTTKPAIIDWDTAGKINTFTATATGTAGNAITFVTGPFVANGGISWTNGSSDARLKKNFEISQGLTELLQIEPVKFHFDWEEDGAPKRLGFKAQNLLPLIPEMVVEKEDKAEDGTPYLTITPDYILPVLVKAIQEQQAIITQLQADVAALKGNA